MKILVTGAAGFIGFHLTLALLEQKNEVVGVDNLNDYYDPALKHQRLDEIAKHPASAHFEFIKADISNRAVMEQLFADNKFDVVVNLAAQAGVRYSLENPHTYIESNLVGFTNILEGCRHSKVKHLVYASSSSVYGMNVKQPFSEGDNTDYPVSLYAATKKSNEVMAHCYSHLFSIPTTGLRFFTVYGPYGRPDMAYYLFTKAINEGSPIVVNNGGDMIRDFTFVGDIVEGVVKVVNKPPEKNNKSNTSLVAPYSILNIGNNDPVSLRRFIDAIEFALGKKAIETHQAIPAGDVPITYADIDILIDKFDFKPTTSIEDGLSKFVDWYLEFYKTTN
jgi:UDP-glucuronate 4-epimerase